MNNRITSKKSNGMIIVSIICIAITVLLIIPTIYVSRYAYPWADDFSYAAETHKTFVETGSFFKAIARAAETSMESYRDWQGTYTSCFLMAMQPAAFGTKLYHTTGFIMLGALFVSYLSLFYALCHKALSFSKATTIAVFSLTYLVSVQMVKAIPEAFTWFNGAVHYTFNHAMFILYLACIIFIFLKPKNLLFTMVLCLFGFFAAGGNNITVLTGTVLLIMICISIVAYYRIFKNEPPKRLKAIIPMVGVFTLGAIVNFAAPGNRERMAVTGEMNTFFGTIRDSFIVGGYSVYYNFSIELAVIMVIIGVIIWHEIVHNQIIDYSSFKFPLPGFVLLLSYCLLSAEYAPVNYTSVQEDVNGIIVSALSMNRVNNCIYYSFVLLVVFNEIYFLCWLYKKIGVKRIALAVEIIVCFAALLISGFSINKKINDNPTSFLTSAAIYNLKTGSAQYYGLQMQENINRLESDEENVLVTPLGVDPDSLYPKDAADWKDGTKHFYGKESVEYEE